MKRIILFISGAFSILYLDAQGCSDAGFCTIGNLKPTAQNIAVKQKLSIGITNGVGDENVFVSTPSVQYDNQLSKQWAIQAKFTANYASGNLANVFGLGDLFVSGNYSTTNKQQWQTSYLVACKFPLNEGNLKKIINRCLCNTKAVWALLMLLQPVALPMKHGHLLQPFNNH